jgi:hypothetical protein
VGNCAMSSKGGPVAGGGAGADSACIADPGRPLSHRSLGDPDVLDAELRAGVGWR